MKRKHVPLGLCPGNSDHKGPDPLRLLLWAQCSAMKRCEEDGRDPLGPPKPLDGGVVAFSSVRSDVLSIPEGACSF